MSDVEFVTQRNWEQRRHAEEFAAQLAEENKVIWLEKIATVPAEPCNDSENRKHLKRNRGRMAKAAKAAGRMALVMSAASALTGSELLFPLFGLVAVIFYTLYFEFQEGWTGLWHKI